ARNVLDDLQDRLTKEEISLRRLAGILPTQELHLKGDFASEAVPLNLDSLTQSGLANSIDMKTADDAILTRQIQSRSASLGDKPSVGVTFAYGFKNGFFPDIDVFRGNFAAALDVKVPIFEGRRTMGSVEEADANVDAAENHRADVESHVRADVAQAVADLRSAAERLQTSELDVQQASSAVSLAKVRFDAGVITNLDLLDAQTGLQEARLSNLRALYNFVISRFDLRRAVGEKIW
ncbi:MAG TPA: TolC family protein, partial [Bacteroidota bacterium]|nr:TolC family protein [Bacteroidota bacterium]